MAYNLDIDTCSSSAEGNVVSVSQQLAAASEEERPEVLKDNLKKKLGSMLGVSTEDIEGSHKLSDLGVDSLMAVELKNWIDKEMKTSLSVLDLTGGKSINDLAVKILSVTSIASAPAAQSNASSASTAKAQTVVLSKDVYVCYQRVTESAPKARIVCFPYLGGLPSVYQQWTSFLPKDVELWVMQPQSIAQWDELLPLLTKELAAIEANHKAPWVFFGHSMGGLFAYEVASRVDASAPLIVSAIASPDVPR